MNFFSFLLIAGVEVDSVLVFFFNQFSFSEVDCLPRLEKPICPGILSILDGGSISGM